MSDRILRDVAQGFYMTLDTATGRLSSMGTTLTGTRDYLELIERIRGDDRGPGSLPTPTEVVLRCGHPGPEGHMAVLRGPKKECFRNAAELASITDAGYTYVEGWAMNIIPTGHAWCEKNGCIADPTWGDEGSDYLGIEIPVATVMRVQALTGVYGVLEPFSWPQIFDILQRDGVIRMEGERHGDKDGK